MIPQEQLEKQALRIKESIDKALLYVDGKDLEGVINKITLNSNVIKVFIALSGVNGKIEKIEIYDVDGDLLQVQDMEIVKDSHYKFLAVVEISVENEVIRWFQKILILI